MNPLAIALSAYVCASGFFAVLIACCCVVSGRCSRQERGL